MRLAKSGLTVLFFAFAVLCMGSANVQAQTFSLKVCDTSKVSASVAITQSRSRRRQTVRGPGLVTVTSG